MNFGCDVAKGLDGCETGIRMREGSIDTYAEGHTGTTYDYTFMYMYRYTYIHVHTCTYCEQGVKQYKTVKMLKCTIILNGGGSSVYVLVSMFCVLVCVG